MHGAKATSRTFSWQTGWGSGARVLYAFLLAVVFPFICWGQNAQAGHPHLRPHFVFAQPPMAQPLPLPLQRVETSSDHTQHSAQTAEGRAVKSATGQSTPATLALFLLLLIGIALLWLLYMPRHARHLLYPSLGAAQSSPKQPIPPPRPA